MIGNQMLTVSEAAREAGVNRGTIQRWIAAGRLKKRRAGKVKWSEVVRCRDRQRSGRPHGSPASEWAVCFSEAQEIHARPFLDGRRGLLRFAAMLPGLVAYHVAAGRKAHISKALLDGANSVIVSAEYQARVTER